MRTIEIKSKNRKLIVPVSAISCIEKVKITNWYGRNKWTINLFVGLLHITSVDFSDEDEADELYNSFAKDLEKYENN